MSLRLLSALGLVVLAASSAAQPVLEPDVPVAGTLMRGDLERNDGSYYDLYRFDVRAGTVYTIELRSDAFDAYLSAGRTVDELEWSDDDSAGGLDSRLTFTAPTSGQYVVLANSLSDGESGPYSLQLSVSGRAAPPSRPERHVVDGTISSGDAVVPLTASGWRRHADAYTLHLSEGQEVSVEMTSPSGSEGFDTYLKVVLGDETVEQNDDAGSVRRSALTFTADRSGAYTIYAGTFSEDGRGPYELTYEVQD